MRSLDRRIVEQLRCAPCAPFPGGLRALRAHLGSDLADVKAAVQRLRWAGRMDMATLRLSPSMLEESAAVAETGVFPSPVAEGVGGDTTAPPAPEAKQKAGSHMPREREREKGVPVPEAESVPPPPPPAQPIQAAAARPSIGAPAAPYQAPARASWVEQHLARRDRARAFLAARGRHPFRFDAGGTVKWQVPGWSGSHSDHDLIAIAQEYGFEGAQDG